MGLKINIRQVAESRGVKTAYQLQVKANLAPSTAARLYRNNITQITLDTLEKLCEGLDCEPSDLFVRSKSATKRRAKG